MLITGVNGTINKLFTSDKVTSNKFIVGVVAKINALNILRFNGLQKIALLAGVFFKGSLAQDF
jgi:hypothetical protein